MQQRKKEESASESDKNGSDGSESSVKKEKRKKTASPKRDYVSVAQLNREIEELLSDPANESFESVDVSVLDGEYVPLTGVSMDIMDLVVPQDVDATEAMAASLKNGTKKRKNNRTGWPKCSKKSRGGVRKSTNSDVVNVKSEDLCGAIAAVSPDSEIFGVSSSTESGGHLSDVDAKTAKDSDTLSFSAKSCFISDDPEEVNGTSTPSDEIATLDEERRSKRRTFYQPIIALNRLDTQLVFNSYSLRSSAAVTKETKGKNPKGSPKGPKTRRGRKTTYR